MENSTVAMLKSSQAFSGFSVGDTDKAAAFYGETLGLEVEKSPMGLKLHLGSGADVFVYPKAVHVPASFTILNFPVDDIDEVVDALVAAGVKMEQYGIEGIPQDEKGIVRNDDPERGPAGIAWFTDPAGNVLSVLQQ